jgi:hypothetical protein
MTWEEIDNELLELPDYIKYRTEKMYDIYSPPPFTKDSLFYRDIQVFWIPEFSNKSRWKNELKYIK